MGSSGFGELNKGGNMPKQIDGIPLSDDIPAPSAWPNQSKYYNIVNKMDVGQSFVVFGEKERDRVSSVIRRTKELTSKKFRSQKDPAASEPGFYRVWRLE
jgi:hypothetical protein